MVLLLSDPRVAQGPVREVGDPIVGVRSFLGRGPVELTTTVIPVRRGLARRLERAAATLPRGFLLKIVEGHRSAESQQLIIDGYTDELRQQHPHLDQLELARLSSRYVAPLDVAPHVAAAAVDLTLADEYGEELDLGTAIDATPEQSDDACYFAARNIDEQARRRRELLARVLDGAGLVNYPTEWWHWSYGDRYWAVVTGAPHAIFGPVEAETAAA